MKKQIKDVYALICPMCLKRSVDTSAAKVGWYGRCSECGTVVFTREPKDVKLCSCVEKREGKTKNGKLFINYHCMVHGYNIFSYPKPPVKTKEQIFKEMLEEMKQKTQEIVQKQGEKAREIVERMAKDEIEWAKRMYDLFK